jgi:hypothetical protein
MYYVRNWLEESDGEGVTGFAFNCFSKESITALHTRGKKRFYIMNRSRLDLPHIKLFIANKIANGSTQREIAKELNTSQSAIFRMTKREDVRELIDQLSSELLQKVKEAFEKINNNPHFMAVIQEGIEKNMINYLKRL